MRCANAALAAANAMPKTSEPKTTPGTSCANEHRDGSADCASRHDDGVVRTEAATGYRLGMGSDHERVQHPRIVYDDVYVPSEELLVAPIGCPRLSKLCRVHTAVQCSACGRIVIGIRYSRVAPLNARLS